MKSKKINKVSKLTKKEKQNISDMVGIPKALLFQPFDIKKIEQDDKGNIIIHAKVFVKKPVKFIKFMTIIK